MTSLTSQPTFWILTALAGGRRHGYEIIREAGIASGGRVSLKATTLYASLDRLERDGQIARDGEEVVNGRARRYYVLTEVGSAQLATDLELLAHASEAARSRLATRPAAFTPPREAVI